MADRPPYPDTGTPRWVLIAGIVVLVLALLVGIVLLTGVGGDHGPGRHLPSGGSGGRTPPSGVIAGHTPPGEPGLQRP